MADDLTRQCGPCQACCVVPEIPELGKKAGERCQHLTEQGCGIYETRPDVCRAFECGWKVNPRFRADDRPDVVGIMTSGLQHEGLKMNVAHELRPGAFDSWKGERLVKREGSKELLGLRRFGAGTAFHELRLAGPKRLIGLIRSAKGGA